MPRGNVALTAKRRRAGGKPQARVELGGLENHAGHRRVELAAQGRFGGAAHGRQRLGGRSRGALRVCLGREANHGEPEQTGKGQ